MSYRLYVRRGQGEAPLAECAERFARMLSGLAAIHPLFGTWYRKAGSRAAAFRPFCTMPPQTAEMERILYLGRHLSSGSREPAPDLGYSVAAWNGQDDPQSTSFSLRASVYWDRPAYPNQVVIESLKRENREVVNPTVLKQIIFMLAECWDAEWGGVETWAYEGKRLNAQGHLFFPYGGWLTYLCPEMAAHVTPPPDIAAERLPNGGLFMLATDELFDVANPVHVARLDSIQEALAPIQR